MINEEQIVQWVSLKGVQPTMTADEQIECENAIKNVVTAGRLWELGMSFTWVGFAIIATGSIIQLVTGRTTCSRSL